jgi:hypothetical protein
LSPARKQLLSLAVLVGAVAVLAPLPATAAGTSKTVSVPCWKRLLNDWYDGTINNVYPIACYGAAIKHLPADLRIYGSAKDDILAAEQAAIHKQPTPPEKVKPGSSTTTLSPGETTETTTVTTNGTTTTAVVIVSSPTTTNKKKGFTLALAKITPGDSQSFPLPLLILGALAIILVIGGIAGMFWQRSHPRDEPPPA